MLNHRYARTGQWAIVYFISDLDPSGLDLQRAWEEALANFGVRVSEFVRIGLTREQVDDLDSARYVKASRSSPATVVLSAISSCMASAAGRQTFSRLPSSSRRSTITPAPGLTTAPPRSSAPAPCCLLPAPWPLVRFSDNPSSATSRLSVLGAAALSQASGAGHAATSRKHRMRYRALTWLSTNR
jgi:hypothetical protein